MNLNDILHRLPEYAPRPDLWDRIEAELRFDEHLQQVLPLLPDHEPTADNWSRIENRLDEAVAALPPANPFRRGRMGWAAAAAVAGLVGGWFWLTQSRTTDSIITYSEELVQAAPEVPEPQPDQTHDLIRRVCAEKVVLCEKPEVKELRNELADLQTRQAELNEQLAVFGNDPALLEARLRLESQQAELTQQLTTILAI